MLCSGACYTMLDSYIMHCLSWGRGWSLSCLTPKLPATQPSRDRRSRSVPPLVDQRGLRAPARAAAAAGCMPSQTHSTFPSSLRRARHLNPHHVLGRTCCELGHQRLWPYRPPGVPVSAARAKIARIFVVWVRAWIWRLHVDCMLPAACNLGTCVGLCMGMCSGCRCRHVHSAARPGHGCFSHLGSPLWLAG